MPKNIGLALVGLLVVGIGVAAETPSMPFPLPPGATYTREEMGKGKDNFILYTITMPKSVAESDQVRHKEALAGCAQSVTSRSGWSATEPNNFVHLSGPCMGRTFRHPGKTIGPYTACTVDFKDE